MPPKVAKPTFEKASYGRFFGWGLLFCLGAGNREQSRSVHGKRRQ